MLTNYMKAYLSFVLTLLALTGYSQNSLNSYKYVIVPERFGFSKENNQYGLSSTTQLLLQQKGFVAEIGSNELPPAVAANKCSSLIADVLEKNGIFTTNLTLVLKDCQGNVLFKSKEGKSREKEWPLAYNGALRDAFTSLDKVPYQYDSTAGRTVNQMAGQTQQTVPALATAQVQTAASAPAPVGDPGAGIADTLYAQAVPNGYQLIDITPKKVLVLLKTSVPDYYIATAGTSSGVVFKKDDGWFFEYYKDGKLVSQRLKVSF